MKIRTLKFPKRLSQEKFYQFCRMNEDVAFERDEKGNVIIMFLKGGEEGSFNAAISAEVGIWNRQEKKGKAFDSSTGFTLPDSSVRGSDTAWIAIERWKALPKEDRKKFAHISPDFVIEIRSINDSLEILKDKMLMYIENGVRLGW